MTVLDCLSSDSVKEVAADILNSSLKRDFAELAHQVNSQSELLAPSPACLLAPCETYVSLADRDQGNEQPR